MSAISVPLTGSAFEWNQVVKYRVFKGPASNYTHIFIESDPGKPTISAYSIRCMGYARFKQLDRSRTFALVLNDGKVVETLSPLQNSMIALDLTEVPEGLPEKEAPLVFSTSWNEEERILSDFDIRGETVVIHDNTQKTENIAVPCSLPDGRCRFLGFTNPISQAIKISRTLKEWGVNSLTPSDILKYFEYFLRTQGEFHRNPSDHGLCRFPKLLPRKFMWRKWPNGEVRAFIICRYAERPLGRGASTKWGLAIDLTSAAVVATGTIATSHFRTDGTRRTWRFSQELFYERDIYYKYRGHPYMAEVIDSVEYQDKNSSTDSKVRFFMSVADGSLFDFRERIAQDSWFLRLKIFLSILNAVRTLHEAGEVHRDIKSKNCLFFEQTEDVRLIDFGALSPRDKPPTVWLETHAPPEMMTLLRKAEFTSAHDSYVNRDLMAGDIWELGVLFFELLTGGNAPGYDYNLPLSERALIIEGLKSGWFLEEAKNRHLDAPQELLKIINLMLDPDPTKRPKVETCFDTIWPLFQALNNASQSSAEGSSSATGIEASTASSGDAAGIEACTTGSSSTFAVEASTGLEALIPLSAPVSAETVLTVSSAAIDLRGGSSPAEKSEGQRMSRKRPGEELAPSPKERKQ